VTSGSGRYLVISVDCHAGADLLGYRDYLEASFRDDFDHWASTYVVPYEDLKGEHGARNWDSARRVAELEADGIAAEVVFPNTVPPFFRTSSLGSQLPPEDRAEIDRRWAGLQAHNRWLVDFCADQPGRRAGIIQLNLHDIPSSVRQVQWARQVGLTGGVLLPGAPPGSGLPPLHDEDYYEPLWDACEDAGYPVNCHSGGAGPRPSDTAVGHVLFMLELGWWDQRTLSHLLLGGVFDRHPDLHFVFTEAGVAWIPQELQRLEQFFDSTQARIGAADMGAGAQVVAKLSCRPTEYWARQCHVGASFMHPSDRRFWDSLGVDTIMWGSDYPHLEASFPYSREAIALTFGDADSTAVEQILGTNAAKLYGFNLVDLEAVARRIGPDRADVAAGLSADEIPPEAATCPAFAGLTSGSARLRWADNRKMLPRDESVRFH
jgi:predicted TIM-barrel fold metal-dependent hydrolase